MLKVETVVFNGTDYRLREPRLRDFLAARDLPGEDFIVAMLGGMLLGSDDQPVGKDLVLDLPLAVFAPLAEAVNRMVAPPVPLDRKSDFSTDSLSQSEE